MLNQSFSPWRTSLLEQQSKVEKTTKFVMGNDGRITECYDWPLFPRSLLVWMDDS
jgi:hypothetical protein